MNASKAPPSSLGIGTAAREEGWMKGGGRAEAMVRVEPFLDGAIMMMGKW